MSISLLNFGMLFGLIALAVPVMVHLLNRRRFDVVAWGAMQFLELGERTRQRIRLSDLLLLLLRLLLIALLVFAFTRPFAKGGSWIRSLYPEPVDLVIVIDSSYSMGLQRERLSPHVRAIQVCHELLDDLTAVDRVAIIDARDQPRVVTPAPVTDVTRARLELEKMLPPDGSANLPAAVAQACQLLTQTFSTRRQVVVLTDRQRLSWRMEETALWNEVARVRQSAAVPIELTAISVGPAESSSVENFEVAPIEATRDVIVQQTPVTFTTRVKYTGMEELADCELSWAIDGQRLSQEAVNMQLRSGEESVQEFTTRFTSDGPHIVTASLDADDLPGDNAVDFVVDVVSEIPAVWLADPPPVAGEFNQTDDSKLSERFLRLAYGDENQSNVWVRLRGQRLDLLDESAWQSFALLFAPADRLAKVDRKEFENFLARGGSVVVLPPTSGVADPSNEVWQIDGEPVLPYEFGASVNIGENEAAEKLDVQSFSAPWLQRFAGDDTDLSDATVLNYWKLRPASAVGENSDARSDSEDDEESQSNQLSLGPPTVDATFQNGDPLFVRRYAGRGQILQSAIKFDGVGNDVVRQRAFVPFIHELAFGLVQSASQRTLPLGQPVVLRNLPCQPLEIEVTGPADQQLTASRAPGNNRLEWVLAPPALSGIYRFDAKCKAEPELANQPVGVPFAIYAPRQESNLALLSEDDAAALETTSGLSWQPNSQALLAAISTSSSGIELWPLLLFAVTGLLLCELLLTRRLVQGGHVSLPEQRTFEKDVTEQNVAEQNLA